MAKKTATKKPETKTAPAKKKVEETAPAVTLRKPQVRILQYLATAQPSAQTRKGIAEGAPVDNAYCTEWLGSSNEEVRAKNDQKHFPSLTTLGYVSQEVHEADGKSSLVYSITAEGKKFLKSLDEETIQKAEYKAKKEAEPEEQPATPAKKATKKASPKKAEPEESTPKKATKKAPAKKTAKQAE